MATYTATSASELVMRQAVQVGDVEELRNVLAQPNVKHYLAKLTANSGKKTWNRTDGAPLHWAAHDGLDEMVRMLVQAKISVNAFAACPDGEKMTPLHMAVLGGSVESVKLLLSLDASLELWGDFGTYFGVPLAWAEQMQKDEIAHILRTHQPNAVVVVAGCPSTSAGTYGHLQNLANSCCRGLKKMHLSFSLQGVQSLAADCGVADCGAGDLGASPPEQCRGGEDPAI